MSGDGLRDEIAAALILHDHSGKNALTRPDDALTMLRDDPEFFICAAALSRADAVLATVQARIEQVAHEAWHQGYAAGKEQAAEQIAQAIEAEYADSPWIRTAIDIARRHAKGDSE